MFLSHFNKRFIVFAFTKQRYSLLSTISNSTGNQSKSQIPNIFSPKSPRIVIRATTSKMSTASGSSQVNQNRLSEEKSPYLLQHATNPVNWFPWGTEAFNKAQLENKPIFLSVGYSTCHWCHVMERESFESQEIADVLNQHYVSIKVDREERPDVDKVYMAFVQRTTGSGGWPMSVFLTPNLEPLFGGTYFPPKDAYGRVGFKSLLELIAKQWSEEHAVLSKEAKQSVTKLKSVVAARVDAKNKVPHRESWEKCFQQISRSYEAENGGFSSAPKFPQPTIFNFLFHIYYRKKNTYEGAKALEMCLHTLKRMAYGGIHDHVGSGFARYSVDRMWHVPHFEKMLYDQAQLACSYVQSYVITKDEFFKATAEDILKYVSRDLSHPDGGFYGAEDADSLPNNEATIKKEGAFYVWSWNELKHLISDEKSFEMFCFHFNVKKDGNVDPKVDHHREMEHKNILCCFGSFEETAQKFNTEVEHVKAQLRSCCDVLYEARNSRPRPITDTKIVTGWNGLMISGFAKAGFAFDDQQYIDRAVKAAKFIKQFLYDQNKGLLRCCYFENSSTVQIENPIGGFLDDYAFLIRGLLDLYEATLDCQWLEWAEILQKMQNDKFLDKNNGAYFNSSADDQFIIIRDKEDQDGAEPCGNSVSLHNLLMLSSYLDRKDFRDLAEKLLLYYAERLKSIPFALPEMVSGLMLFYSTPVQIFIAGERREKNTLKMLDVVRSRYIPGKVLAVLDGPDKDAKLLYERHKNLANIHPVQGKSAAYVCRNFTCSLPVTDASELALSLEQGVKPRDTTSDSD